MRWGVDTYSFHRYLGEVYPMQKQPQKQWDYIKLIEELISMGAEGLSVETCFLSGPGDPLYQEIRDLCRKNSIEMIMAWGHPMGLYGGTDETALQDMISYIPLCADLGIKTMRIVGSNRRLMQAIPKVEQIEGVRKYLKIAAPIAEEYQVTLAIENHQDFLAGDLLYILESIGSKFLGVNYDSGNSLRLNEDPVKAAELLGSWIKAVHIKDVKINKESDPGEWIYWSCVPAGKGKVALKELVETIETAGFSGVYAIELDCMHPDYPDEMTAVSESLAFLRNL